MTGTSKPFLFALFALAAAIIMVGCSSAEDSTSVADAEREAEGTAAPEAPPEDDAEAESPAGRTGSGFAQLGETEAAEVAACLEGHGVEVAGNATNLQELLGDGPPDETLQAALTACGEALGVSLLGGGIGAGGRFAGDGAGNRGVLLDCLAAEGIEVDDVERDGGGGAGRGGLFAALGLDEDDPEVQAALEVCGRVGGGGGTG